MGKGDHRITFVIIGARPDTGNRSGRTVMSPRADKLLIKPSARQTGAAAHAQTDHSQGTHEAPVT
jgi:hypothetical protein